VESPSRRLHLPPYHPRFSRSRPLQTFLTKQPLIESELIHGVRVTTRFASYQDWRVVLLADFYDGSRLRQLVLDYTIHLTINPSPKHMAANNLDISNNIAGAFNLLPMVDRFNECDVVAMVVQAHTHYV
jgi:hypothetical protein